MTQLTIDNPVGMAIISPCGNYRYSLTRVWDEEKPKVMFIMLNPSTADAFKDDQTIRKCKKFAKAWGYGGLVVCNLFAFRATEPKDLLKVGNPFGDANIFHTKHFADRSEKIVCAWGNEPILKKILKDFSPFELLHFCKDKLHYIELSKNGVPKHPLYLDGSSTLKKYVF